MLELLSSEEVLKDYNLSRMIRYNHRQRLCDENVATHSFYVSLFCLKIINKISDYLSIKQTNDILMLATLHDLPESVISDVPHNIKEDNPKLKDILLEMEKNFYKKEWPQYSDLLIGCNDSLVKAIVDLADAYSVQQYCLNELCLGNTSQDIENILVDSLERLVVGTKEVNHLICKGD